MTLVLTHEVPCLKITSSLAVSSDLMWLWSYLGLALLIMVVVVLWGQDIFLFGVVGVVFSSNASEIAVKPGCSLCLGLEHSPDWLGDQLIGRIHHSVLIC